MATLVGQFTTSVADWGAKGDGVNDRDAFLRADAYAREKGCGEIVVPAAQANGAPAVYAIEGSSAYLTCSDVTWSCQPGHQITRATVSPYTIFAARASVRNVHWQGPSFKGSFNPAALRLFCSMSLNRGQGWSIDDALWDECQGTGHGLDLGGCGDIKITNSTVRGYRPKTGTTDEWCQADSSDNGAVPISDPGNWSGEFSSDVSLIDCDFEPLVTNYGGELQVWPCPNPGGGHTRRQGKAHRNILITRCRITDPAPQTSTAYNGGTIHYAQVEGLTITDNVFRQTVPGRGGRVINVQTITSGTLADSNPEVDAAKTPTLAKTGTYSAPVSPQKITITGNLFEGFTGQYIYVAGHPSAPACDIEIGNTHRGPGSIGVHPTVVENARRWSIEDQSERFADNSLESVTRSARGWT